MRLSKLTIASVFTLILAGLMVTSSVAGAAAVTSGGAAGVSVDQVAPAPVPPAAGKFQPTPVYGSLGIALVVYTGGSVDDLEVAAGNAGAAGVWVQDLAGRYQLLPVQAPTFVKTSFAGAFPAASPSAPNFPQAIAVTLIASPALATSPNTVTMAQNGSTQTLRVGDTFLLMLGEAATWDVQVADQGIVSRVPNVTVVRGAQGLYQANRSGATTLTATGVPVCAAGTACPQFIVRFNLAITVLPAVVTSSGIQGTVTLGPTTPVCQVSVPCDRPYEATLAIQNASGSIVTQVRSGTDGYYVANLPPGRYTVTPLSPAGQTLPRASAVQVDVVAGQLATANIQYDTGIR